MDKLNYTYNLKIKILSPLYIGGGKEKDWVKGFDFIIKKQNLYVLNNKKLFSELRKKNKFNEYIRLISDNDDQKIKEFFDKFNENEIESFSYPIYKNCDKTNKEIKSFIRSGLGQAYIPGSSIKGALRSILFNYFLRNNKNYYKQTFRSRENNKFEVKINKQKFVEAITNNSLELYINNKKTSKNYFVNLVFGDFEESIMRYIRVFDINSGVEDLLAIANVDLYNVKSSNNSIKSETKNVGITLECLDPRKATQELRLRIDIAEPLVKIINNKYGKDGIPKNKNYIFKNDKNETIYNLFNIINEYTYNHISKEINFFESYKHQDGIEKEIIHVLKKFRDKTVNNKRSCILRMSYGSGFHGITGDWLFDDYSIDKITSEGRQSKALFNNIKTSKSRRIVNENCPLGFVEIILNDDMPDNPKPFQVNMTNMGEINKIENDIKTQKEKEHKQPPIIKTSNYSTITKVSEIQKDKFVIAEVISLGKPHHGVKIVLEGKTFQTLLSNVKNANINIGDKVICQIMDCKGMEKINVAKFIEKKL